MNYIINFFKKVKNKIPDNILMLLFFSFISYLFVRFYCKPHFLGINHAVQWSRLLVSGNYFSAPGNFKYFNHSGSALNVMNPSLLFALFGLIFKVIHNFFTAVKVFTFLIVLTSSYCTYYLGKRVTNKHSGGIILSVLYILSPYSVALFYWNFSLDEFMAFAFLPIAILGWYEIVFNEKKNWWILTIGLSLVAFSHFISFVILVCVLVLITIIFAFAKVINFAKIKYILLAFVISLLLSLIVLVPMFELYKTRLLINPNGSDISLANQAMPIGNLFIQAFSNEVWHNVNGIHNNLVMRHEFFTFGLMCIVAWVISFLLWKKLTISQKIFLFLSLGFVIIRTSLFPWVYFEKFKFINFIEYSHRLNPYIMIFAFLAIIKHVNFKNNVFLVIGVTLFSSVIFVSCLYSVYNRPDIKLHPELANMTNGDVLKKLSTDRSYLDKYINAEYGFDFVNKERGVMVNPKLSVFDKGDYISLRSAHYKYLNPKNHVYINSKILNPKDYSLNFDDFNYNFDYENKSKIDQELVLPVTVNNNTKLYINGKEVPSFVSRKFGTLETMIKAKSSAKIVITYSWTFLSRISQMISIVSWALFGFLIIYTKKFRNK